MILKSFCEMHNPKLAYIINIEFSNKYRSELIDIFNNKENKYNDVFELIPTKKIIDAYYNHYNTTLESPIVINVVKEDDDINCTAFSYTINENNDKTYKTICNFFYNICDDYYNYDDDIIIPVTHDDKNIKDKMLDKVMYYKDTIESIVLDKCNNIYRYIKNCIHKKDAKTICAISIGGVILVYLLSKVILNVLFPMMIGFGGYCFVKYVFKNK